MKSPCITACCNKNFINYKTELIPRKVSIALYKYLLGILKLRNHEIKHIFNTKKNGGYVSDFSTNVVSARPIFTYNELHLSRNNLKF